MENLITAHYSKTTKIEYKRITKAKVKQILKENNYQGAVSRLLKTYSEFYLVKSFIYLNKNEYNYTLAIRSVHNTLVDKLKNLIK